MFVLVNSCLTKISCQFMIISGHFYVCIYTPVSQRKRGFKFFVVLVIFKVKVTDPFLGDKEGRVVDCFQGRESKHFLFHQGTVTLKGKLCCGISLCFETLAI